MSRILGRVLIAAWRVTRIPGDFVAGVCVIACLIWAGARRTLTPTRHLVED